MEIKQVLQANNFRFNKKFGQNFISDTNLLNAIVSDAEICKDDVVIEIGPGAGSLTYAIAQQAKKVVAFEIDTNLKDVLKTTLLGVSNVEVIFKDVMDVDMAEIEKIAGGPYKVVANLPYYITTPILMRFLEESTNMTSMSIMIQKEVADRLTAKAGTKDYGRVTVAVDYFGNAKLARNVSRQMFYPQPNVDSAVVRIDRDKKYTCSDEKLLRQVVKSAFAMRRKVFSTCLASGLGISKDKAVEYITSLGKQATIRGETLTTQEFVDLVELIKKDR